MEEFRKTNIAFLPLWAAGHIPSTVEFAKRLLLHPSAASRLSVTLLLTPSSASAASSLSLLPTSDTNIAVHLLPDIPIPTLDDTDGIEDYISIYFELYTPHVKSALAATSASALIIDFFATTVIDAAKELNIPAYVFFTTNASVLAVTLHLPVLHNEIPLESEQFHAQVRVPGLDPIPPMSMPSSYMNKKNRCYTWFIYHVQRLKELRGILTNTFRALEPRVLSALEENKSVPPVHSVGPVLCATTQARREREREREREMATWCLFSILLLVLSPPQSFARSVPGHVEVSTTNVKPTAGKPATGAVNDEKNILFGGVGGYAGAGGVSVGGIPVLGVAGGGVGGVAGIAGLGGGVGGLGGLGGLGGGVGGLGGGVGGLGGGVGGLGGGAGGLGGLGGGVGGAGGLGGVGGVGGGGGAGGVGGVGGGVGGGAGGGVLP